jgi:hypothetical protein
MEVIVRSVGDHRSAKSTLKLYSDGQQRDHKRVFSNGVHEAAGLADPGIAFVEVPADIQEMIRCISLVNPKTAISYFLIHTS